MLIGFFLHIDRMEHMDRPKTKKTRAFYIQWYLLVGWKFSLLMFFFALFFSLRSQHHDEWMSQNFALCARFSNDFRSFFLLLLLFWLQFCFSFDLENFKCTAKIKIRKMTNRNYSFFFIILRRVKIVHSSNLDLVF